MTRPALVLLASSLALAGCMSVLGIEDLHVEETRERDDAGPTVRDAGAAEVAAVETIPLDGAAEGEAEAGPGVPYDLTGAWRGTFTVATGFPGVRFTGNGTGTLEQKGLGVTGSISVSNSCIQSAEVVATLLGHSFTGSIKVGQTVDVAITGTVAEDANTLEGEFEIRKGESANCAVGQTGTLRVARE